MGIFDVLKFWKKREEQSEGFPTGMPEFGTENPPMPGMSKFDLPKLGEKMPSDESGFGGAPGMSGSGAMSGSSGMPPSPEFRPFPTPDASTQGAAIEKDFAIVSAKLDTLKAKLELIEQKIEKIEKIAEESR
jgi:hypothetical protein